MEIWSRKQFFVHFDGVNDIALSLYRTEKSPLCWAFPAWLAGIKSDVYSVQCARIGRVQQNTKFHVNRPTFVQFFELSETGAKTPYSNIEYLILHESIEWKCVYQRDKSEMQPVSTVHSLLPINYFEPISQCSVTHIIRYFCISSHVLISPYVESSMQNSQPRWKPFILENAHCPVNSIRCPFDLTASTKLKIL